MSGLEIILKRWVDITVALLMLVFLSPLLLLLISWSLLEFGKVFFCQLRIGKGQKEFLMFKIRTMKEPLDVLGLKLHDKDRLTKISRLIRSYHLDELPQLVNVIKGEMSLVGPRPLPVGYQNIFSVDEQRRHLVKPGITGLAQIKGANSLTWNERFDLDLQYIENYNLFLDCKILVMTLVSNMKPHPVTSPYLNQARKRAID